MQTTLKKLLFTLALSFSSLIQPIAYPVSEIGFFTSDFNPLQLFPEDGPAGKDSTSILTDRKNSLPSTMTLTFAELKIMALDSNFLRDLRGTIEFVRLRYGKSQKFRMISKEPEITLAAKEDGSFIARFYFDLTFDGRVLAPAVERDTSSDERPGSSTDGGE